MRYVVQGAVWMGFGLVWFSCAFTWLRGHGSVWLRRLVGGCGFRSVWGGEFLCGMKRGGVGWGVARWVGSTCLLA